MQPDYDDEGGHGEHLDCGCTVRLISMPYAATCSSCKRSWRPPGRIAQWPTGTPVGETLEIESMCPRCGGDIAWRAHVIS